MNGNYYATRRIYIMRIYKRRLRETFLYDVLMYTLKCYLKKRTSLKMNALYIIDGDIEIYF